MKQCAILSMDCLDEFEVYDELLDNPLLNKGWQTTLVPWRSNNVNWDDFDVVLIRTPWDYQDDPELFLSVLSDIEASRAQLENSLDIVKWNINKKYLKSLELQQVIIVPTLWHEHWDKDLVRASFSHFNVDQIVIKPCVSANADNTFWLTKHSFDAHINQLSETFKKRDFMVQPFAENIIKEGEFSCFYFSGQYSHCILKTPKANDFRVQEEHGGRLKTITPEAKLLEQAKFALSKLPEIPMYARLDFVRIGNEFAMMEAELIEPSLYFNMDSKSAQRFVDAFIIRVENK